VVQFIESLPPRLKLRGLTGKYLHKKAMTRWLPAETVHRKKKGFAHPVADWLKGPLKALVHDCLLSSQSHLGRYFDPQALARIVAQHEAGTQQYMRHIYLLLSLELWHRSFRIQ
jgi:asparagine synthase (glutamine-hydrolysing)